MVNYTAKFITSVAESDKFYSDNRPIIAVSGRSNVGKSSLINMLSGNKKLAKTSVTPGRTRLINYFDFGAFVLADLPGYGFAKVSKTEKDKWARLLEEFFATQKITLLLSLVDIRHEPTADDKQMINYLYHYVIPFTVVATKADKLSKTEQKKNLAQMQKSFGVEELSILPYSSKTNAGRADLLQTISDSLQSDD